MSASEFAGIVSGVTSFGLFVELAEDRKINGLVHITQLPNDYYHFGTRCGTSSAVNGAESSSSASAIPCAMQVLRASLEDRKIDFRLVTTLKHR